MSERTETASARRLQRARDAGDFPRAPLLIKTLVFGGCLCLLPSATISLWSWGKAHLKDAIVANPTDAPSLGSAAGSSLTHLVTLSAPLLLVASAVSIAAHVVEARGLMPNNGNLALRPRANPWTRLGQLFSCRTLALSFVQWVTAAILVGYIWHWWRKHAIDVASALGRLPKGLQLSTVAVTHLAWAAFAIGLALGAIDWLIAHRAWLLRLRLTRAEQMQEHSETEGDPLLKSLRIRIRQEALAEPPLAPLAGATVVICDRNQTAVSLYYDANEVIVPLVLRVCTGAMARRMIRESHCLDIAVVDNVALAQALAHCDVGMPIAEALYAAVAEIFGDLAANS